MARYGQRLPAVAGVNLCKRRELEQAKDAEGFYKRPRRLDQKVKGQEQVVSGRLSQMKYPRRRGRTYGT